MPTSLLTTAVSFGLVTISVSVLPATESHSVTFRQMHLADLGRVRNRTTCEVCGQQLRHDQIGRGWETLDGSLVEITDQDLDSLPLEHVRAIEVLGFNPATSVNPISLGRSYYLAARGDIAAKPYALITRALQRTDRVAVARYSLRDRTRLGLLRVTDGVLVLQQLLASDEVRSPTLISVPRTDEPAPAEEEVANALALADALSAEDLSGFTDAYTEALTSVINAKTEGRQPTGAGTREEAPSAPVVDLMAALTESVTAARAARGEDATVHQMPPQKRTAKKTAAKKAPPGKTGGRKPRIA
ncbi:Ku protein [Streptomyces albipurpureus]|uniref:Ku protein n=1 Tax=Streptomyces albipurpureus TaxID=2897419 RepID=A0ABT0V1Z4_9ACTN|nr:Ku protein [Streptomyces sp. CWNU-1]MCM2393895.1 Ku protein [Streptomyces sp. CWNU-1]